MLKLFESTSVSYIIPIICLYFYFFNFCVLVQTHLLKSLLLFFKNHFNSQYKILSCISGVDYPKKLFRFSLVYELLSLKFNNRLRIKVFVDELTPMSSIEQVYSGAFWWECEIWDMFGVFFLGEKQVTRLLTDYGFLGYPLRKDFPLSGFFESKYSLIQSRVIYENLELAQEYRAFDFTSPWELASFN